jgi:hypothetical protein
VVHNTRLPDFPKMFPESQPVNRRPLTLEIRVRTWANSFEIYGGEHDSETGFLWVLRFAPLLVTIPPILHIHSCVSDAM